MEMTTETKIREAKQDVIDFADRQMMTERDYRKVAMYSFEAGYRAAMASLEQVGYQHRDGMFSCRLPGGGVVGIDWTTLYRIKDQP